MGWRHPFELGSFVLVLAAVPSPPCGMATTFYIFLSGISSPQFRAHRVGWRLVLAKERVLPKIGSEPTVWDGDVETRSLV